MTPKQISKEFTDGLRNIGLSDRQIKRVVVLARHLLSSSIPLEPPEQVERKAIEVMGELLR